jgi:ubiquinone/menaquinone biosynthesis C-methylase UbiE
MLNAQKFANLWPGGSLEPSSDKRGQQRIKSWLKKFVDIQGSTILEIGPGRGYWSRWFAEQGCRHLVVVDVISPEEAGFWEYVGEKHRGSIEYIQVTDSVLSLVRSASVDLVFSYNTLCYIRGPDLQHYMKSMFRVCRPGALLVLMYGNPDKYLSSEPAQEPVQSRLYGGLHGEKLRAAMEAGYKDIAPEVWSWFGIQRFSGMVQEAGLSTIDADLGLDLSNPIALLTKRRQDYTPNISRLASCPYLAYNSLALLADHVFDLPTNVPAQHDHPVPFAGDVRHIRSGDFVFVKTDLLWDFCAKKLPQIVCPFFLLVGHSSYPVDVARVFKADVSSRIMRLVSTNAIGEHPLMVNWPIGFREFGRETGKYLVPYLDDQKENIVRSAQLLQLSLTYHDPNTNAERAKHIQAISARGDVNIFGFCRPDEYFCQIWDSAATICLPGRGYDTHRVYEALLLGCRPVVQAGHPLETFYASLGCTIVPDITHCSIPTRLPVEKWEEARALLTLDISLVQVFVAGLIEDSRKHL